MKNWLVNKYLPMWAKETVFRDNRELTRKVRQLQQENETLRSYIKGLHRGMRGREAQ